MSNLPPRVIAEGDSISIFWSGNYTGIYSTAHIGLDFLGTAVGGSALGTPADRGTPVKSLWARLDSDLAIMPTHMTVLIGANDLDVNDPAAWAQRLFAYTDTLRAAGIEVAVGTVLPQCRIDNPGYTTAFNAARVIANQAIRSAAGTHFDLVIDFASDQRFGEDTDACDLALFGDGVHPTGGTQQMMAEVYAPVVDKLIEN